MSTNMKRRLSSPATVLVSLAVLALLWVILRTPLAGLLWVLASVIFAVTTLVFFGLSIANLRKPSRNSFAIATLGCVAGCLLFTFSRPLVNKAKFAVERALYEKKLALVLQAKSAGIPLEQLGIYDLAEVDDGPPVRVAFYWSRGVVDNWVGLVYDPTGDVMKANAFKSNWTNWHDPNLQPIKMLFDGDLFRAQHLSGHWYLCSFT